MAFKDWVPGAVLTAADLDRYMMQQDWVVKTSDQSVTNSATPVLDSELMLTVEANSRYWVDAFLIADGATGGDLQLGWTGPAGCAFDWVSDGLAVAATTGVDAVSRTAQGLTNLPSIGMIGVGSNIAIPLRGVLTTAGSGGVLRVRWAQATANATATRMRAGSLLRITKLVP
ncbi:hypothetical protein FHS43_006161 [Streptosporangium becharense]|uniref:Uncharacterized protein n=1 Tax=Streptosporangium becharense TaxID=1816182 RepID=A0A7W9IH69_9ACTN|nr:hypothetical protein [Streptosporangium becharense]MBB2914849.1 hypothetical protein [Streptosporangium becharense]MBB5820340.1 hypothetical protein [Streptosporangium becharense]